MSASGPKRTPVGAADPKASCRLTVVTVFAKLQFGSGRLRYGPRRLSEFVLDVQWLAAYSLQHCIEVFDGASLVAHLIRRVVPLPISDLGRPIAGQGLEPLDAHAHATSQRRTRVALRLRGNNFGGPG